MPMFRVCGSGMGDEVIEYHEAMGTLGCSEEFAHGSAPVAVGQDRAILTSCFREAQPS
jgi:hypothetical protein